MTHVSYLYIFMFLSRQEKNGSFNSQNVFCYTAIFSVRFPTRRRLCTCVWSRRWTNFVWTFPSNVGMTWATTTISAWSRDSIATNLAFKNIHFGGGTNEIFVLAFQWDYERFLRVVHVWQPQDDLWSVNWFSVNLSTPWLPQQYLVNRSEEAQ